MSSQSFLAKSTSDFADLFTFVRQQYPTLTEIPLHVPSLGECEKKYLAECIDSTFVSSVGPAIKTFEDAIAHHAQAKYAIALVNGTAALQLALLVAGVKPNSEVITQSLTFIGTANAIAHCAAEPVFVDVDRDTLGLSPRALRIWLENHTEIKQGKCINRTTQRTVSACVCMHTFGHPAALNELKKVCEEFSLPLIEDAAEAFGSRYHGVSVGAQSVCGIFSFNGNKILTTGGGGALVTNDEEFAIRARHLATTAKLNHPWESQHDEVGYNFRMPNLNAALGLAQMQHFHEMLSAKRQLALAYQAFFDNSSFEWVNEPQECEANYWLNAILCVDREQRDSLLVSARDNHIQMRPVWQLLSDSKVYKHCQADTLANTREIALRLVNLPSSAAGSIHAR